MNDSKNSQDSEVAPEKPTKPAPEPEPSRPMTDDERRATDKFFMDQFDRSASLGRRGPFDEPTGARDFPAMTQQTRDSWIMLIVMLVTIVAITVAAIWG